MNNVSAQANRNQVAQTSNTLDPASRLPSDTFHFLHSFLSPFSISNSLQISKLWRELVIKNPSLFREMDLSRLGHRAKMHQVLHFASQLSSLSNHTLRIVHLDLTSFLEDFNINHPLKRFTGLDSLLQTLELSKGSLIEIYVKMSNSEQDDDAFHFFLPLMSHLLKFKQLLKIQFTAPFMVAIEAESEGTHPKRFTMINDKEHFVQVDDGEEPERRAFRMYGKIKKFIGPRIRITKLRFATNQEARFQHFGDQLLENIMKPHKASLQSLKLGHFDEENPQISFQSLWEFAISCEDLKELDLDFESWGTFAMGQEFLRVPEGVKKMETLETLQLSFTFSFLENYVIRWDQVANIIGNKLKELSIELGSLKDYENLSPSSTLLSSSILFNSRSTLKHLKLREIDLKFQELPQTASFRTFPSLESLKLIEMSISSLKCFCSIVTPALKKLKIASQKNDMVKLNYLMALLEAHYTLEDLEMSFGDPQAFSSDSLDHFTIDFPNLKRFRIFDYSSASNGNSSFAKWLSRFNYPNLVEHNFKGETLSLFKKNAPKLKV